MKKVDCPHEHCVDGWLELHGPELEIVPCQYCVLAVAPTEQPNDSRGRFMLNGYGRACWNLGHDAAEVDRSRLLAGLQQYGQHESGCAVFCQECNRAENSSRHRDYWQPGSGVYWHDYVPKGACTCGLDALRGEEEAADVEVPIKLGEAVPR